MSKNTLYLVSSFSVFVMVIFVCISSIGSMLKMTTAQGLYSSAFEDFVDSNGNISLPDAFQNSWAFLGGWAIDQQEDEQSGAAGFHNVYTQPGVVEWFTRTGSFPDGAMLIKELLAAETGEMTTGTVSHATEVQGWFIMVKDTQGRFEDNPLWGDGWGWALFNADEPANTVTSDYKEDCLGCHIPAQNDDWIYLSGYPLLFK